MEFILSGDNLAAAFLIHRTSGLDFREATDLGMEIGDSLALVIRRGQEILQKQRSEAGS